MEAALETINWTDIQNAEARFRHEVMAHIHAFSKAAPEASPIIHLGATSMFVLDNTELLQIREGLTLLTQKLESLLMEMSVLAREHKDLMMLGYTHLQPAQPTTLGKRIATWAQSLLWDLQKLRQINDTLPFRGIKGATGTQASLRDLMQGMDKQESFQRTLALERWIAEAFGFKEVLPLSGQVYERKIDVNVLQALSGIGVSAHKLTNDLRLLQSFGELEEPFRATQVGSSAMPYKRNPMQAERVSSLAKFLMVMPHNAEWVAATQWLERTLDDSANKRLSVAESFLSADAILDLLRLIFKDLVVYPAVIQRRLDESLPFILSETLLMQGVKKGGDRQALHEVIRGHAMTTIRRIKEEGAPNDFLEKLSEDPAFPLSKAECETFAGSNELAGFASEQTLVFLEEVLLPALKTATALPFANISV